MPLHQRRLSLALLLIVLLVVPTLLAQTDPLPLPTGESENGRVGSSPTPLTENLAPLTLLSPADGATIVDVYPTFSWTADPNASEYKIVVKRGEKTKFKQTFLSAEVCQGSLCQISLSSMSNIKALKFDKTYQWSVKTITTPVKKTPKASFTILSESIMTFNQSPSPTVNLTNVNQITATPDFEENGSTVGVRVDVSTTAQLINEIANCTVGEVLSINLNGGTYTINASYGIAYDGTDPLGHTGLPVVRCRLTINGNFSTIQRLQTAAKFRIFTVIPGGNLTLNQLTIRYGSATDLGGGGILNHKGILTVNTTTVTNNVVDIITTAQTIGAGVYSFNGTLAITRSTITNNLNTTRSGTTPYGDGGGIGIINNDGVIRTLTISASDIRNNSTNRDGGAVAMLNASGTVANGNCFVNNSSLSSSRDVYSTGGGTARNSWWGASGGPNSTGDSASTSVSTTGYLTTQPASCTAPPVTPTNTPTNTPNPTVTPGATGLAAYGVTVSGWTSTEQNTILTGVTKVGQAFAAQKGGGVAPNVIFKRIFLDTYAWDEIQFIRNPSMSGNACVTTIQVPPKVECPPAVILTEYTVVHEIGHLLVGRTGAFSTTVDYNSSYFKMMNSPNYTAFCPTKPTGTVRDRADCDIVVFGKRVWEGQDDWVRGKRGWGSGATPLPNPSNFQQNPYEITDAGATQAQKEREVDEAAADMFLNWVYFKLGLGGFQNTNWNPVDGCSSGCPDSRNPGTARYNWMNQTMQTLFNYYNW